MRVSILQSNYVPWAGFFNLVALSDVTVVYDSVQFTKNDWRNRNILITGAGPLWLTIPVVTAGRERQQINAVTVSDHRWATKHWRTICQNLSRLPHFSAFRMGWQECFERASRERLLHDINLLFLHQLMSDAKIPTSLVDDRDFDLDAETRTDRLVSVCRQIGANTYLTGPAGLNYLDLHAFQSSGLGLEVVDYSPSLDITPGVRATFLQTLAAHGPDLSQVMTSRSRPVY